MSKLKLIIMFVASLVTGIHFLVSPETVNPWIIKAFGIVLLLDCFAYLKELMIDFKIKNK